MQEKSHRKELINMRIFTVLACAIILTSACSDDISINRNYEIGYNSGEKITVQYRLCRARFDSSRYANRLLTVECYEQGRSSRVFVTTRVRSLKEIKVKE